MTPKSAAQSTLEPHSASGATIADSENRTQRQVTQVTLAGELDHHSALGTPHSTTTTSGIQPALQALDACHALPNTLSLLTNALTRKSRVHQKHSRQPEPYCGRRQQQRYPTGAPRFCAAHVSIRGPTMLELLSRGHCKNLSVGISCSPAALFGVDVRIIGFRRPKTARSCMSAMGRYQDVPHQCAGVLEDVSPVRELRYLEAESLRHRSAEG